MPELPEVERARRIAEAVLVGRTILAASVADDRIVYDGVAPRTVARRLKGRRVEAVERWGKHFWLALDGRPWPVLHLGMTGRVLPLAPGEPRPRFWKLLLSLDTGERLAYTNARRLGRVRLRDDPPARPPISKLGFDPLHAMPAPREVGATLARRAAPIKAVLLDQSFAAGVGNWIADEVLYQAGLSPHRPANALTVAEVARLMRELESVIRIAVEADADAARFPSDWLFHRRWRRKGDDGLAADGTAIVHETIAGRTAAWAPAVQR